jgi:hypothetical protein
MGRCSKGRAMVVMGTDRRKTEVNISGQAAGAQKKNGARSNSFAPLRLCVRSSFSFAVGLSLSAGLVAAQAGSTSAQQQPAAVAAQQRRDMQIAGATLGEQLVDIARENLIGPMDESSLKQSAALIEAATRLDPTEPRYLRLLADAKLQLHDVPGEIAAWSAYRKLAPDDRVAQVRLIDLYAGELQTADSQQKYFGSLLDMKGISPEVKSHVATEAARLLLNRSEKDAWAMADRAVKFYPLPEAVALQFQLLPKDAAKTEKLKGLLAIIRVDPVQAEALQAAAELLSHAGLVAEARPFFAAAVDGLRRQGNAPSHKLLIDYVADLYLAGYDKLAGSWADSVLAGQPNDVDFQFFQLTRLKKVGLDGASPDDALSRARDALAARWVIVNNRILGLSDQPPGQGEPVMPPDPQPAASKLAQAQPANPADKQQTQQLKDAFISAMDDMAWLELYYADKPDDAKRWIDALKVVAPKGNMVLERLEGWYALQTQKPQDAAQHFEAFQNDVLSELGLIQVAKMEGTANSLKQANDLEQKLISAHYGGLIDTIIHQALPETAAASAEDLPTPPAPPGTPGPASGPATRPATKLSAEAGAMLDALKQFPASVLDFTSQPQKFYSVHLTAMSAKYRYAQPMLAMVSIQNVGEVDLPIDTLGPVQPMVVYEADAMQPNTGGPARAFDELTGRLVLRPGEGLNQVVRLDQGPLGAFMQAAITPGLILVSGQAYTNPVIGKNAVAAGSGGQRAGTDQLLGREVPDLIDSTARHQFYTDLQNGPPDVRIDSLDLLAATSRWLHRHPEDAQDQQLSREFVTVIDHYSADPVAYVADWARYRAATVNRPDAEKLVQGLMTDKDWLARLLSLMAMRYEPFAIRRQMTTTMTKDSDATVKALAAATLARLSVPATQPAPADQSGNDSAPMTQPAVGQ